MVVIHVVSTFHKVNEARLFWSRCLEQATVQERGSVWPLHGEEGDGRCRRHGSFLCLGGESVKLKIYKLKLINIKW